MTAITHITRYTSSPSGNVYDVYARVVHTDHLPTQYENAYRVEAFGNDQRRYPMTSRHVKNVLKLNSRQKGIKPMAYKAPKRSKPASNLVPAPSHDGTMYAVGKMIPNRYGEACSSTNVTGTIETALGAAKYRASNELGESFIIYKLVPVTFIEYPALPSCLPMLTNDPTGANAVVPVDSESFEKIKELLEAERLSLAASKKMDASADDEEEEDYDEG